ncbi:sensor histidine kinase [Arcobacter sp. FWKO B]|uniref:sensor histidine kinase n=1 Tax=Arcobacter sp. FWKO B TaxID=2593672 RepID=UPI0018A51C6F|nr:HAMP domain-containing sensor histidine kinase [Arcobacter sp. FWKO B]QOG11694.1 HAMP domain-containing histidine kinase [Arcobacter sp. FWKO B]
MIEKLFTNLSIKKIGLLSSYLIGFMIFLFAMIIVNEEYKRYEKEMQKIEIEYTNNEFAEKLKEEKTTEHKITIMRYVIGIGGVTLFMFFTVFGILRLVAFLIDNEFKTFIDEFANSSINHTKIEKNKFNFEETKDMVDGANSLVQEIIDREKELRDLNLHLEDKVKEKTKKLQVTIKAQDEFIKKSIHEINTPLSIILTNIDLLKMQNITNKYIRNIESGSKVIHNIYNDLSYMIKKDRIEYPKQIIHFSKFLFDRVDFFDEIAKSNNLDFVLNIKQDINVNFNDVELQRIIDNNLSNAIKYSYPNQAIFIRLDMADFEYADFSITTISKPIKNIDKICDDFYREDTVKGGFGLGLKIVKDICDKNGVIMSIESSIKETKFTYRFKNENIIT